MKTLRKLAEWILPAGIYRLLLDMVMYYQFGPHTLPPGIRESIEQNKNFLNRHHGERCFILATGPSINKQDLRKLEYEHSIAVGDFYLHPDIAIVRPEYHCVAPYHRPFTLIEIRKRLIGLIEHYSHPVNYFFGHNNYDYSVFRYLSENPNTPLTNVHYINYLSGIEINEDNYRNRVIWDIGRQPFMPKTVVYIAIQLAAYMGFTKIYLLGVDHDYLHDIHRVKNHHFYPEEQGINDAEHLSEFTTERWFEEYYYRWKQYRLMRQYLVPKGIHIYNATRGGMLDVFPRVEYEELFT